MWGKARHPKKQSSSGRNAARGTTGPSSPHNLGSAMAEQALAFQVSLNSGYQGGSSDPGYFWEWSLYINIAHLKLWTITKCDWIVISQKLILPWKIRNFARHYLQDITRIPFHLCKRKFHWLRRSIQLLLVSVFSSFRFWLWFLSFPCILFYFILLYFIIHQSCP